MTERNYKCPKCKGEFNSFDTNIIKKGGKCPFCGLKKGEYGGEEK